MHAAFGTIASRMRFNFFSRSDSSDEEVHSQTVVQPETGQTFPADEVVWGIAIRNGFDELDDPLYHRGLTQHAYLEGNDNVAICGFRPPQSGPRTRRRSRLGLPTHGEHPMCGSCARMVVTPRPRVSVPVQPARTPVAVPVFRPVPQAIAAVPTPVMAAPVEAGASATAPLMAEAPTMAPYAPSMAAGVPSVPPDQARGMPPVAEMPPVQVAQNQRAAHAPIDLPATPPPPPMVGPSRLPSTPIPLPDADPVESRTSGDDEIADDDDEVEFEAQ